jgi:hypothetical protein
MEMETWSKSEKAAARRAFDAAYRRECRAIIETVCSAAAELKEPADLWRLHDSLSEKRRETDRKYDYRYSVLFPVFGQLMREGWLKAEDLAGLSEDKRARVARLAQRNLV